MTEQRAFVDFYKILQVNPNCDAKILESAYHYLAKMHHPDHSAAADTEKFSEVVEAYRVLRDPELRSEYDLLYAQYHVGGTADFPSRDEFDVEEQAAASDADDHDRILRFLYKRRRENAQDAGVIGFYIQEMLDCSDEHFEFHKWYLKEKGFVALTEQGSLAITIEGVDHIISMSRKAKAEKLLLGQLSEPSDQSDADPN